MYVKTALTFLLFPVMVFATTIAPPEWKDPGTGQSEIVSAFREYKDVPSPVLKVPTVVEVPFGGIYIDREEFHVVDLASNATIPSYFREAYVVLPTAFSVESNLGVSNMAPLHDGKRDTFVEFPLSASGTGQVTLTFVSPTPITATAFHITLDAHVAYPKTVTVRVGELGKEKIVLFEQPVTSSTVFFPRTSATTWRMTFTFGQPLRISEFSFAEESVQKGVSRGLRFLAQPGASYRVYFNPDRRVNDAYAESGNLSRDKGVLLVPDTASYPNPSYVIADVDGDGVADVHDNCVALSNPDQKDIDENGGGDACEDFDRDRIMNEKDNCPNDPNVAQTDTDGDGTGDACDGEESRITERHAWVPWAGMGIAALVLVVLMTLAMRAKPKTGSTS